MDIFARLVAENELLLLFFVIMLGLGLSRLKLAGLPLGLAGVLFAGLGLSAAFADGSTDLRIAPELKEFGLVLFVYCVGLTSGSGFFTAFRKRGLRLNLAVVIALISGTLVAIAGGKLLGLEGGLISGVFCGALTNTPALGAATEVFEGTRHAAEPIIGYSVTYPFGVLGALLTFRIFLRTNRKALALEQEEQAPPSRTMLANRNCRITNPSCLDKTIGEQEIHTKLGVIISRIRRGHETLVPSKYTVLHAGDIVALVGTQHDVSAAVAALGEESPEHLEESRARIDMRRILVSKKALAGKRVQDLELDKRFHAQITRLRRADLDILPSSDFRIEIGDRLRIVAERDRFPQIAKYFGDSEKEMAEVDFIALCLGLCAGLILGEIPIPIGGSTVTLGSAGGPLLVALVLGRKGRTGPFLWSLPHEVSTTLRDLGLLLFLAGVGVSAGGKLGGVMNREGLVLLGLGALVTLVTSAVALILARKWAGAGVITSMGSASGMQTQPATLRAAYEFCGKSEETYVAYALVYPVAMFGKILLAQLIAIMA